MQAGLEHMHGSNAFLGQFKGWFLFLASLSDKDVVRYSIILEQDSGLLDLSQATPMAVAHGCFLSWRETEGKTMHLFHALRNLSFSLSKNTMSLCIRAQH